MNSMSLRLFFLLMIMGCFISPNISLADEDEHDHSHSHHAEHSGDHHDHHEDDHDHDEHHSHEGFRGGYFADANDIYHTEFILEQNGLLKMYLYDGKTNPMKVTGIPASWALAPDNDYPLKGVFKESEDGEYYWVQFPEHDSEIIHLSIHVQKEESWPPLEYYLPVGKK